MRRVMSHCSSYETSSQDPEVCWICLEEGTSSRPLSAPCACPRRVHPGCLARWQLQSAGRREEKFCRFCSYELPDWRSILSAGEETQVPPVMTVMHRGQVYVIPVQPGPNGLQQFQENIRNIFGYDQEVEINLSFGCTVPGSGEMLTLEGCGAFDAAVHCAAVSAGLLANRNKRKRDLTPAAASSSRGEDVSDGDSLDNSASEDAEGSVSGRAGGLPRLSSKRPKEVTTRSSGSKRVRAVKD